MTTETVTNQINLAERAIDEASEMPDGSLESMERLMGSMALSLVVISTCLQDIVIHLEDIAIKLDRT